MEGIRLEHEAFMSMISALIKDTPALSWWLICKETTCQCSRCRFDPWEGKKPWRRKFSLLQYSCLGDPMDRGAWWAAHGVAKELDTTY